ncbi:MAG: LysM peptidoglycan-binding domain-containing protein [Chloroflexota bacterium]
MPFATSAARFVLFDEQTQEEPLQRSTSYLIYVVQEGDNLYKIADKFGLDVNEIMGANAIKDPDRLFPGQELNVPQTTDQTALEASRIAIDFFNKLVEAVMGGEETDEALAITSLIPEALPGETLSEYEGPSIYVVEPGDSLNSISEKLDIAIYDIISLNLESRPDKLMVGQELIIPSASQPESQAKTRGFVEFGGISPNSVVTGEVYRVQYGDTVIKVAEKFGRTPGVIRAANSVIGDVLYTGEKLIIPPDNHIELPGLREPWWPVDSSYRLSSPYYPGHAGIDVVLPTGAPVQVIADGFVESVSFDPDGYGIYIVVIHNTSPTIKSLYAHLDEALVEKGQKVDRENIIGLAGNTGNSSSTHLHLEIIESNRRLNPCYYLKGGCR